MTTEAETSDVIAEEWHNWAKSKGLYPDRPTEIQFRDFYSYLAEKRLHELAALADGGDRWSALLDALAHHGYTFGG
jgi:hypothetical protein